MVMRDYADDVAVTCELYLWGREEEGYRHAPAYINQIQALSIVLTSAAIGAWNCNFLPF